jgi:hypothetical protein
MYCTSNLVEASDGLFPPALGDYAGLGHRVVIHLLIAHLLTESC